VSTGSHEPSRVASVTDESAQTRLRTLRATLFVVAGACCFGSIAPLTLLAMRDGASLQSVQAWRYITSAVLLVLVGVLLDRRGSQTVEVPGTPPSSARAKRPWYHPTVLLIAGTGQSLVATLSLLALEWITAATTGFLFYTYPAWVTIITAVRGIEVLSRTRVLALGIALAGIAAMIGAPDAAAMHPAGVALALSAALIYAAYIPVLGVLQHGRGPMDVARAISVGGSLIFFVWAMMSGGMLNGFGAIELAASVGQGVLSAGAFIGFLVGLRVLGPVRTAITSTAEPFWTTILGVLMLSQPAGLGTLAGGLGIVAAVVLLQRRGRSHSQA